MPSSCCVPFCKTDKERMLKLTFHEIPVDLVLREKWLKAISRKDWVPNDRAVVCSQHFEPEDYKECKRSILKRGSVPSIFKGYPSYMHKKACNERSCEAIRKRKLRLAVAKMTGNQVKNKPVPRKVARPTETKCDVAVQEVPLQSNASVQVNVFKTKQNKELRNLLKRTKYAQMKLTKLQQEFLDYKIAQKSKFTPLFRKVAKAAEDNNTYAMFIMDQIKNFGCKHSKWSEPTIRECIKWRGISNKGYEQARRLVHLPSRSTLARFSTVSVNGIADVSISESVQCYGIADVSISESVQCEMPADEEPVVLDLNSEDRNDWSMLAMCVEVGSDKTDNTCNGIMGTCIL